MNTFLFVTLSMIGVIVVFVVGAIWFFKRNGMQATMMIALPFQTAWPLKKGDSMPAEKIWPMLRLPGMPGDSTEPLTLKVEDAIAGRLDSAEYRMIMLTVDGSYGPMVRPWRQVLIRFVKTIDGKIIIHHIGNQMRFGDNDEELESIDFNKQVTLKASSRKLAFQVFSSDFMDWYISNAIAPSILFQDNMLTCIFVGAQTNPGEILSIVEKVIHSVQHSGALGAGAPKKPTP